MKISTVCLLLLAVALPAYAGQGTIEETDDAIIVEYTGDAPANSAGATGAAAVTQSAVDGRAAASASATEENDPRASAWEQRRKARAGRSSRRQAGDDGQGG